MLFYSPGRVQDGEARHRSLTYQISAATHDSVVYFIITVLTEHNLHYEVSKLRYSDELFINEVKPSISFEISLMRHPLTRYDLVSSDDYY